MRDTSLAALETVSIADRQFDVLRAIRELGQCTDEEIRHRLGWKINCVTPRRGELVKLGQVEECGKKLGPTGRSAIVWRIAPQRPPQVDTSALQQASLF